MANSASSKKRVNQNERNRVRNKARKSEVKTITRKFMEAVHQGNLQVAEETFVMVQKKLDQVSSMSTLHRNTAARRKSRLARKLNAARTAAGAK